MDKPEPFDLIIAAIDAAHKEQQRSAVVLTLTPENGLERLGKQRVLDILEDFQREDGSGIIRLSERNFPERQASRATLLSGALFASNSGAIIPVDERQQEERERAFPAASPNANEIYLEIFDGFDDRLAVYRLNRQDDLASLSPLNLAKIYCTVLDIDEKLQVNPTALMTRISTDFRSHSPFLAYSFSSYEYRTDALTYLKNKDVIRNFGPDIYGINFDVTVSVSRFQEFKDRVIRVHQLKEQELIPSEPPPQPSADGGKSAQQDSDIIYEVKLTTSREILLNNILLARPGFGSENEILFRYLFDNPNRPVTIAELQKQLGDQPIKKGLHKIVENLGFLGDFKDAFFSVSKDTVLFRNPVRRKDLEKLGKDWLRLPRPRSQNSEIPTRTRQSIPQIPK